MKNSKSAPASAAFLLGKKLNEIQELKFNDKEIGATQANSPLQVLVSGKAYPAERDEL